MLGLATVSGFAVHRYALHDLATLTDEGLSTDYDSAALEAFWTQHKAVAAQRLVSIALAILPFALKLVWTAKINPPSAGDESAEKTVSRQTAAAREFRQILTNLGPTFIKFGQMLSIRPDILPTPVLAELQKLCDSVPPYSTTDALRLIETELQRPVEEVFLDLGPGTLPIAAASLGQVYRCRLRSTGETVAVKVQRPDMLRSVTLDLFLIRRYAIGLKARQA